jgi:hypothetical protein
VGRHQRVNQDRKKIFLKHISTRSCAQNRGDALGGIIEKGMDMESKNINLNNILTPEEVSQLLQISIKSVYKHSRDLGGFYLPGMRTLRFSKETLNVCLERQVRTMEVPVPVPERKLQRTGVPDKAGSGGGKGRRKKRGQVRKQEVSRHGLHICG